MKRRLVLYAGDAARFYAFIESWPADLRDHARRLAAAGFADDADSHGVPE